MPKIVWMIGLLVLSNVFMTFAWYFHLKHKAWPLVMAIFVSWMIALPEYILHVPANRLGHASFGGPLSAPQLKIIQEAITLLVFAAFSVLILKEKPRVNEYVAMLMIFGAVVVAMWGRTAPTVGINPQSPVVELATDPEPHSGG